MGQTGIIYLSRTLRSDMRKGGAAMRCKSEETMEQIKNAVEEFYFSHYRSPSTGELAAEVGYAKSTVHSYLWEMDRRGLLSYNGKTAETAVTRKANAEVVLTPVLGGISCGQPEYAEEDFEAYVALPTALFGSGEFFLLRARGYSMVEAGIEPGDLVVIKKQNTADEGDIIVALVDNETTLKRFYIDYEKGCIRLHPENSTMEDIYTDRCYVQGVAQQVIKQLT